MLLFKHQKEDANISEYDKIQKAFFEDMSLKVRDPLNAMCGIAEIAKKNAENNYDKDQIISYLSMLQDSATELKQIIDECFSKYETIPADTAESNKEVNDFDFINNLRVLVAEDTEVNQMVVRELLSSHGAIVTTVKNGQEAVDAFTKSIYGTYDLILMDINMPVMDGYEATDRIRHSDHKQAQTIPIVAVTGDVYVDDIQMALKVGMNAHVAKPYSFNKILNAVKNVM